MRHVAAWCPLPANKNLLLQWFVQLCLLIFGQTLPDDFKALEPVLKHGLFGILLRDTDRREQDGFCRQRAVRHLRLAPLVFVPREFYRSFRPGTLLLFDWLIDGHQLRAVKDSLDGTEI